MLKFTKEQQANLLANRRAFNAQQADLAGRINNAGFVGNAYPMPRDVWGLWDSEGIEVQRQTMRVFNDLAATLTMPMPIGKMVHHFQQISDSGSANISLDGVAQGLSDQQTYTYVGTPLPIVTSAFGYGWRQVEAAHTEGVQLDAAGRLNAVDKVAEKLELLALDGDSKIVVGGTQLYGFRTHPKVNTRSTTNDLSGCTGAEWVADVVATLQTLHADKFKVPATLYVNWSDWFYAEATEYTAGYPKKIAAAVREIPGVQAVVPSDKVAADEIIAVVKDRRVVQVLSAMPVSTRAKFRANPEDRYDFVTMAAAALEIKYDAADNCGVAYSS